jgi:hypothetical protein
MKTAFSIGIDVAGCEAEIELDGNTFSLYEENGIWILYADGRRPSAFKARSFRKALLSAVEKALEIVGANDDATE